ncbi:Uncharacterised protein [Neisseria meningitidis]|nr:Uncharacterised protein [Neisseria meningitidis]
MRQISLTDYFCKGLYLFDIFEDIVFLGKRLFTVRKFLDFSELLEMVNTQGYFLEFLYFYSGLNLNQYGVPSPSQVSEAPSESGSVLFVLSAASPPCPDFC